MPLRRSGLLLLVGLSTFPCFAEVVPSAAEVIDSQGRILGPVADFTNVVVSLQINGQIVPALVNRNYLSHAHTFGVVFQSDDCSGTAFTPYETENPFAPAAIVGPSNAVYLGPSATPSPVTYLSSLRAGASGCQAEAGTFSRAAPVAFVGQLTPPYLPPFVVRPDATEDIPGTDSWSLLTLAVLLAGTAAVFLHRWRTAA